MRIADVGTGSGCIAITLAKQLSIFNCQFSIYATDISKKALEVAKINVKKHKVTNKIKFLQGDLLKPLPEKVDFIVANLPYVDDDYLKSPNCPLKKEPKIALDGGGQGLVLIEKLLKQASRYLNKNGQIFLKFDPRQTKKIEAMAKKYFLNSGYLFKKDLAGQNRYLIISA